MDISEASDDELLKELASRNRVALYIGVRDVSASGVPVSVITMRHGKDWDVAAAISRLQRYLIVGEEP